MLFSVAIKTETWRRRVIETHYEKNRKERADNAEFWCFLEG